MAERSLTQPNATALGVDDLVNEVLSGRVRIPEFQRSLRWAWEDVRRLFDSILRGYPIGSLLLWERRAEHAYVHLGSLRIDAPAFEAARWVVDGQQRLTSLACTLSERGSEDSRFALAYDLKSNGLVRPDAQQPLQVPLPTLFDLQRLLAWFAEHPEAMEHLHEATRVAKAIREYKVPVYVVKQQDETILRDIFDRMNNYGKRLSRAEVFTALHSTSGAGGPPRTFADIAEHLDTRFGFGPLDDNTVLRAFLARRGPDVTREIRTEFDRTKGDFPDEREEDALRGAEAALERVVGFLQRDALVPHLGFLPYRYLLVVLARFFAHHRDPCQRNRDLLRRWYWRAAVAGPTFARGAYTSAMRQLASCIVARDETGSVQHLLEALPAALPAFVLPQRFRSTHAELRFALCALWDLGPRSPVNAEKYDSSVLLSALAGMGTANDALEYVVTRVPVADLRGRTSNRIFLLGNEDPAYAREMIAQRTLNVSPAAHAEVLASHAITLDAATHLERGEVEEFLRVRHATIQELTRSFLARMTESAFEDTPPLEALDLDEDDTEQDEDGARASVHGPY